MISTSRFQGTRLYQNRLRQLHAPLLPRVGQTFTFEAYAHYGQPSLADVALPFVSSATATIPLLPLGTLRIDPSQMIQLPPITIPQPGGVGSIAVTIPNAPGFVGVPFYIQAMLTHAQFQPRSTNFTAGTVIR